MESAGKQLEDEELRDAMKDSGLGTPATRAAIIERLKNVGYITMQGKRITITQKGRSAIELIRGAGVELLTSPEMTGQWERRLNEISRGQAADDAFMEQVKKFTRFIVEKVRVQPRAAKTAFEPAAGAAARAGAAAAQAGASPARAGEREYIAACPRPGCGGRIFLGNKGYGCSNYKTGCRFVIWKRSLGKTITPAMIKSLVEKGRTNKLKLIDRSGAPIEGRIVLKDPNIGQVEIEPIP
jgi:DNA topoisomerase-3